MAVRSEKAKATDRFVREAKKYVRFLRRRIAEGAYDEIAADQPLLKAFDALVFAEHRNARRNKGSM